MEKHYQDIIRGPESLGTQTDGSQSPYSSLRCTDAGAALGLCTGFVVFPFALVINYL